jgi:hypothetical protein
MDGKILCGRDVVLQEIVVTFSATADRSLWHRLLLALGRDKSEEAELLDGNFVALSETGVELSPYLIGSFLSDELAPDHVHWSMTWARTPGRPPPPSYVKENALTGGFPRILQRLADGWPNQGPVTADVKATYTVLREDWELPAARRSKVPRRAAYLARMQPVAWSLSPKLGALAGISIENDSKETFDLTGSGTIPLGVSPIMFNQVDGAMWQSVAKLLQRPRSGD